MTRVLTVAAVSAALIAGDIGVAAAGCAYGSQSLPGSINAYQTDAGRFYTSGGGQMSILILTNNGNLRVTIPGCGTFNGNMAGCTHIWPRGQQVHPVIYNPNPFTVTYQFNCD